MADSFFFQDLRKNATLERLFFLIVCLGAFLRFFFLDYKLFHHDEAIHAWFSYDLLTKGSYTYDPMYHGPFLYYVTTAMFWLFGDNDVVARTLPALFGTLTLILVYYIYKLGYLNGRQTLVAALFIALSPDLVYFSRFLRHDVFQLFFTLLIIVAGLLYLEHKKLRFALLCALGIAGGLSCKEDMPIMIGIFVIFLIYAILTKKVTLPRFWKRDLVIVIAFVVGFMALFYSTFGLHPEVLIDGWLKAFQHWTEMHKECRICGPWFFYISMLVLYELPIFLLAIYAVIEWFFYGSYICPSTYLCNFFRKIKTRFSGLKIKKRKILHEPIQETVQDSDEIYETAEEPENIDTFVEPVVEVRRTTKITLPPFRETIRQELFMQLCIFWALITLIAYGYIGEKVPWLLIHQLLPIIFIAVYRMTSVKTLVSLAGCVFLIIMAWHVAFVPVDINEPIVQVQNSEDLREVFRMMDSVDKVMVASKDYWPLPWYYRGSRWDKILFYGDTVDLDTINSTNPDMIIFHDEESYPSIAGYDKKTFKLDYWFSLYDNEKRLAEWFFKRDGKVGSVNVDVFTRSKEAVPPESPQVIEENGSATSVQYESGEDQVVSNETLNSSDSINFNDTQIGFADLATANNTIISNLSTAMV